MEYGRPSDDDLLVFWWVEDGVKRTEFVHEMSDEKLLAIIEKRWSDCGHRYAGKDARKYVEREIIRRAKMKEAAKYCYEDDFREEVVCAMVDGGVSRRVAQIITKDYSGLMEQAKKYGVI
jgi:hypothetical protein